MPTLDFKGKQFVYSHHHAVPFRELQVDAKRSLPPKDKKAGLDDNLIIHGDNLHALKALMPQYAGKIKCIYIDPPYNTGNEGWCYNDNVNSPLMKEWLQKNANPVDKEDLQRHDKWLCMMWPRLKLLHELLADDGVIFVSIDDNEIHNFRSIANEVFGEDCFVSTLVWEKKKKGAFLSNAITNVKEYVVVFCKKPSSFQGLIGQINNEEETYPCVNASNKREIRKIPAGLVSKFRETDYRLKKGQTISAGNMDLLLHSDMVLKKSVLAEDLIIEGNWRYTQDLMLEYARAGELYITQDLYLRRIVKEPRFKTLKDLLPRVGDDNEASHKSIDVENLFADGWGSNEDGEEEIRIIFEEKASFSFPKPRKLIEKLLVSIRDKNAIVLDSFAGSGTTAHAVLDLNKEDDGNRKFILVEMEDYADKTTAERVRRVIRGVSTAKDERLKQGVGGSFTFCNLGNEINIEKIITGESLPDYGGLAKYVFYTATGHSLDKEAKPRPDFFVGETDLYEIYLIYKPDIAFLRGNESALNDAKLKAIAERGSKKEKLVFATAKYMGQKELSDHNITFCQLPYAIHKVVGA